MTLVLLMTFMTMTATPDMVVTTDWLADHLDDPGVVLVEVGSLHDFNQGHLPGARFVDRDKLVINVKGLPDEMPAVADLERLFGNAGLANEGRIIIYSREPLLATRMWFTLDYLGHGDRAAILDGGFPVWQHESGTSPRPITKAVVQYPTEPFAANADPTKLLTAEQLRAAMTTGVNEGRPIVVLDARPALEYTGWKRGDLVSNAGHIRGAECVPWTINYTDIVPAKFKPIEDLRAFYDLRVDRNARIILYCRTGMEASSTYFTLRRLGYDNIGLYDGSYIEWNKANEVVSVATK